MSEINRIPISSITGLQAELDKLDGKVTVDGFAFLPENIAVVDGANGDNGTAQVGFGAYLTFEAASTAVKAAYDLAPSKKFLVYVKAFDGFYSVITTVNGQHIYPEVHYYFEPKAVVRSSGTVNKPFGDSANGAGNYWIHGKGEFYADPTVSFSVTWGFARNDSNVFLSASIVQNLGIVNDLGETRSHIEVHIDKLLTTGNFQGTTMRGGNVKFYGTDFIGGMWWGTFFQRQTTMTFDRCKFRLSPTVHNPLTGAWVVKDKSNNTLFTIDMTDTDMSRQSRLADFSLFTTIQDAVNAATTVDSRVACFEIGLNNNTFGLKFKFIDCEFFIDQDKGIGMKIVKSTDLDATDKSSIELIRPRFIDTSGGTTTALVAYKTSTTYSDFTLVMEEELSNADTLRTSHGTPATNPDIELSVPTPHISGMMQEIWVDDFNGSDVSGDGTMEKPFESLTPVAAKLTVDTTIYVNYNCGLGDLTIPSGVTVIIRPDRDPPRAGVGGEFCYINDIIISTNSTLQLVNIAVNSVTAGAGLTARFFAYRCKFYGNFTLPRFTYRIEHCNFSGSITQPSDATRMECLDTRFEGIFTYRYGDFTRCYFSNTFVHPAAASIAPDFVLCVIETYQLDHATANSLFRNTTIGVVTGTSGKTLSDLVNNDFSAEMITHNTNSVSPIELRSQLKSSNLDRAILELAGTYYKGFTETELTNTFATPLVTIPAPSKGGGEARSIVLLGAVISRRGPTRQFSNAFKVILRYVGETQVLAESSDNFLNQLGAHQQLMLITPGPIILKAETAIELTTTVLPTSSGTSQQYVNVHLIYRELRTPLV